MGERHNVTKQMALDVLDLDVEGTEREQEGELLEGRYRF